MASGKYSIEKLDIDNYATWSANMRWLLTLKTLSAAIEPAEDQAVDAAVDQKALALIGLYVADHHKSTLAGCETANEAWEALKAVYKAKSNARRLHLLRELHNLKLLPGEHLTVYFSRARSIRNQLLAAGHELEEEDVVWSILAGLPIEYESMVNIIQAGTDDLEMDDILPKLMLVEQRLAKPSGATFKVQAFTAVAAGEFKGKCWKCGKRGHRQSNCQSKRKVNVDYVTAL